MRLAYRAGLLALTLGVCVASTSADEVVLDDGSRIVGTVVEMGDGKLKIKTDFAGELTIDAAKVKGLTTAQPLTLETKAGERVIGNLNYMPETGQAVKGQSMNVSGLDVKQVKAVWTAGGDSPEMKAAKAATEAAKPKWSLKLQLGIDGQTGNSETVNVNGKVEAKRTTPTDRFITYGMGRYTKNNGKDSAKEVIGGAKIEVDLDRTFYVWGKTEMENDAFENLDLRASAAGGLGLFVVREEDLEVKFFGGPGFQHESYNDGTSRNRAIVEAGETINWKVTPWFGFDHAITFFPSLDEVEEYRLVMENAGEIPLTADKVWKLRLGVRTQYNSEPVAGAEKMDNYYFANLVLELK